MKPASYRLVLGTIWIVGLAGVGYLIYLGQSYYLTPLIERPRHPDYWTLKPGGFRGHLYGVIGVSLMIVMHVYSMRRRVPALRQLGKLRDWLNFHIFCGIMGPLMILLHSSFKLQGLVSVAFWSMWTVTASGFFGRFLYQQLPRRRSGVQLTLKEIEDLNRSITQQLRDDFGLSDRDLDKLSAIGRRGLTRSAGAASLLLHLILEALPLRWRVRRFARGLRPHQKRQLRDLVRSARRKALIERKLYLLGRMQQLFHYWHILHMPIAVVMYALVIIHVAVAIATGYGWPKH